MCLSVCSVCDVNGQWKDNRCHKHLKKMKTDAISLTVQTCTENLLNMSQRKLTVGMINIIIYFSFPAKEKLMFNRQQTLHYIYIYIIKGLNIWQWAESGRRFTYMGSRRDLDTYPSVGSKTKQVFISYDYIHIINLYFKSH